jgi:hypothetical protein
VHPRSLQDAKRSARWISEYLGEPALASTVTKLLTNQSAGWSRSSNPFIEGGNQVRGVTILNANIVLGACLWSGAALASALLLPSQETTNFYNAKMCRDAGVLSALKAAAEDILKTRVMIAGADGPKWSGYQPDDVRLEAVSILSEERAAIFCSVTIAAKKIKERILYSIGPTGNFGSYGDTWVLKFGGNLGSGGGGHKLFPDIIVVAPQ